MRRLEAYLVIEHSARRMRPYLCLLVCVASSLAVAAPAVVAFPAIGRPDSVTITGRVYKDAATSGSSTFSKNLRRLTASNWDGAPVEVKLHGETVKVASGKDGVFTATLTPPEGKPFPLGVALVDVRIGKSGASSRSAVQIVADEAPFLVISDFDDTLAITHVLSTRRLLQSALLQDSNTQPVVPGMSAFYGCLRDEKLAQPGFALVSGSPHQFVPRAATFLSHHQFPFFGMYLRNLGPSTLSGYKQPRIKALLEQFPQPLVLVGDSGEKDPEIYKEILAAYPDRIAAIYIRDAGRTEDASRFEGMVLFQDAAAASADALSRGLVSADCHARAFPMTVQTAAPMP